MISKNKILSLAAAFLLLSLKTLGQVGLVEKDQLSLLSGGYTHVIVNERNFPGADEFLDVFKKNWTLTKGVDFVKLNPLKDKLISGDSYFVFAREIYTHNNITNVNFFLQLMVAKEKRPGSEKINEITVANIFISLFSDSKDFRGYETRGLPFSFDGDGHIMNWTPGTVKNYLQQLTAAIQANKKITSPDMKEKAQLQALQSQPLYCTMDDFNRWKIFHSPRPYEQNEIDDIFKGYDYTVKMVTNKELSDKILTDKEPFYYLVWNSMTPFNGFLSVINSCTGEMVYCTTNWGTVNLERSDLRTLGRAVTKSSK